MLKDTLARLDKTGFDPRHGTKFKTAKNGSTNKISGVSNGI